MGIVGINSFDFWGVSFEIPSTNTKLVGLVLWGPSNRGAQKIPGNPNHPFTTSVRTQLRSRVADLAQKIYSHLNGKQDLGVNPKIGGKPPNHPFVHRVFHEINHPFWRVFPLFLETPIYIHTHLWRIVSEAPHGPQDARIYSWPSPDFYHMFFWQNGQNPSFSTITG